MSDAIVAEPQRREMRKSFYSLERTPDATDRVPKLGCRWSIVSETSFTSE